MAGSDTNPDPAGDSEPVRRRFLPVLVLLVGAALLFLLWEVRFWLAVAFAAVVVAAGLCGGAMLAERFTPLRGRAALAAFVATLLAVIGLAALLLAGRVVSEFNELAEQLPAALSSAEEAARSTGLGRAVLDGLGGGDGDGGIGRYLGEAMVLGESALTLLAVSLLVAVCGLYLAGDPSTYVRGVEKLTPQRHRGRVHDRLHASGDVLRRWLSGQLLSMALLGLLTTIGLWLLGVPLALALGLLTAALCFIPNLGPILSVIPPVLLALGQEGGGTLALGVIALYGGIQLFESYVSTPLIQERAVKLPPALLILGQVVAASLLGVLGLAIAAPLLAVVLKVFHEERGEADG